MYVIGEKKIKKALIKDFFTKALFINFKNTFMFRNMKF